jgi:predicted CoA-binding protein
MSNEHVGINSNIGGILKSARTVAVVGISGNPGRASYRVAMDMRSRGYTVIPVNPQLQEWEGLPAWPDLTAVPVAIDFVDIFRRSEAAGAVVDEAISIGAKAVWMQLGVLDHAAAQRALDAGLDVVMDRCVSIELSFL